MVLALTQARKGQSGSLFAQEDMAVGLRLSGLRLRPRSPAKTTALLRIRYLFPFLVIDSELLRYGLQRGIELNEAMLDGGMGIMTRPATVSFRHGFGRFAVGIVRKVGPLLREAT